MNCRNAQIVIVLLGLGLSVSLASSDAMAQENTTPYQVAFWPEVTGSVVLASASVLVPMLVIETPLDRPACGSCNAEGLFGLDRPVAGYHSETAQMASDYLITGILLAPLAYGVATPFGTEGDGWDGYATDTAVYLETMATSLVLTQIVKYVARRPRPLTYNPRVSSEDKAEYDSTLSFWSGHTNLAFTSAVAGAYTYQLRNPDGYGKYVVWGAGLSASVGVGLLRVSGGKHFWTDVIAGAAAGTAVGFLVPWLHLHDDDGDTTRTARQGVTSVGTTFLF